MIPQTGPPFSNRLHIQGEVNICKTNPTPKRKKSSRSQASKIQSIAHPVIEISHGKVKIVHRNNKCMQNICIFKIHVINSSAVAFSSRQNKKRELLSTSIRSSTCEVKVVIGALSLATYHVFVGAWNKWPT